MDKDTEIKNIAILFCEWCNLNYNWYHNDKNPGILWGRKRNSGEDWHYDNLTTEKLYKEFLKQKS